jgi:hypothetical protein
MTTTIPTVKKFPGIIIVSKPLTTQTFNCGRNRNRGVIIPSASRVVAPILLGLVFTIASN